jgi:predicted ester cyclase
LAFTLTGTHTGALMGVEATGKRVNVNGTVFSRFEAGQIVEEWEVIDQLSLFEQLGVVSLPR